MKTDILKSNFELESTIYPKNIFAIRIKDNQGRVYDISVKHNGYCPDINSEREQSSYNDYLSNLEYSVLNEYFKSINKKTPKEYSNLAEVMTNGKGELYYYSRVANSN